MRRVKHLPISDDELKRLMSQWRRKGDTDAAIVAGTFLEDRIGFAIKACLVELPDKGNSENTLTASALFDGYGPLASFFAKIDMGYALGLCDAEQRIDLHTIRSIRNDFAHAVEAIQFSNVEVVRKLNKLHIASSWTPRTVDTRTQNKRIYLNACAALCGYFMGRAFVIDRLTLGPRAWGRAASVI